MAKRFDCASIIAQECCYANGSTQRPVRAQDQTKASTSSLPRFWPTRLAYTPRPSWLRTQATPLEGGSSSLSPGPRHESAPSTVFRNPSSNRTRDSKPNFAFARLVSNLRRGCPFGLVGSNTILPVKPVRRAINSTRSLMLISKALPRFTGSHCRARWRSQPITQPWAA